MKIKSLWILFTLLGFLFLSGCAGGGGSYNSYNSYPYDSYWGPYRSYPTTVRVDSRHRYDSERRENVKNRDNHSVGRPNRVANSSQHRARPQSRPSRR